MKSIPEFKEVLVAAKRLRGHTLPTPMTRSDAFDEMLGRKVWFKPECNQKVGAFKYRGAFNRLSVLTAEERKLGVVAFSSGNHAQGVSRSAKELGISAIIVMPSDAPRIKVDGVIRDGAEVIFYDRHTENRETIAARIAERDGRIVIPSYDDPYIISGQGTAGLEIIEEARALGVSFDGLITPIGGGGLCAGICLAFEELSHGTKIFCAEPEHYNDHQLSLKAGVRTELKSGLPTLCDALMTPMPGELTFPINSRVLSGAFAVSDQECLRAMAYAKRFLGVQCEPGGAAALAALLSGALSSESSVETVCIVLSGGNVDPEIAAQADALI